MALLGWIGTAIGVVAFLGAVAVFLRGSADKGTIESQARSITALNAELGITNVRCDKLDTRVNALENENEVLRAAVSHSEEIRQLQTDLSEVLDIVRNLAA